MRFLESARARAREARQVLGASGHGLLDGLRSTLLTDHGIELVPVDRQRFLQDSRGEVVPAEGCLYYDNDLGAQSPELLEVVAHEYGHLVLHHDAFGALADDLIRGSVFLDTGAAALSRYSPRSRAEAEASAFAAELICPALEVFGRWRSACVTVTDLASVYTATPRLVRQQLAEGLYSFVAGDELSQPTSIESVPTPEQEAAARAFGSPALVDAGPGTGKTRTLVRRVEILVRENQVPPENILILTFSNEAASELQERIRASLGEGVASRLTATTFHGFGMVLLHALGHHAGLDTDFSVLDEICQEELLTDILGGVECEALIDIKDLSQTAAEAVRYINYLKDRLIGPGQLSRAIHEWPALDADEDALNRSKALLRLFEHYEQIKNSHGQVDFADLIALPQRILAEHDDVRASVRQEFAWVLVDEYQDVSRSTALLLQQICGDGNPPWVVGDARQAIYRFRGAEPENVTEFARDFPGAQVFELSENYRSAPEVISVVNYLAALLANPSHRGAAPERWRAASQTKALGDKPLQLAEATNDAAERQGIVDVIHEWIGTGIGRSEIAVLARRNVDVRNIAIALKERGVRAVTSGLLTAEGAGGDLAAALSAVDSQQALARVVYAVHRHRASPAILNAAIAQVLKHSHEDSTVVFSGPPDAQRIALETWTLFQWMQSQSHCGDGWSILCDFLFFMTPYVRDLISRSNDADGAVQLEEVLSALSLAAQYRLTHPHVQPRWSRLGLAERLRDLVTQAAPGLVPPRANIDAIRVMTCHASKGLEFPCVAVAGQSLADIPPQRPCLPPSFRANSNEDLLQAESLLFVGVSRAKRAAIISYATSASGTPRSRRRRFPNLLTKLSESGTVPLLSWNTKSPSSEEITVGRVWGGDLPSDISTYALGADTCRVRTYLEEQLGARFRGRVRPLYPDFISRVRRILRQVVALSVESGQQLGDTQLSQIVDKEWPVDHQAQHPHIGLYRPRACRWAKLFAQGIDVQKLRGAVACDETFQLEDASGVAHELRLNLVGHFRDSTGDRVALALQARGSHGVAVNWSDLKDYERLPFVLLQQRHGGVQPYVFTGSDGEIRSFKWKRGKAAEAIAENASHAREAFGRLVSGAFDGTADDWTCDRCACRTICPWWVGAVS